MPGRTGSFCSRDTGTSGVTNAITRGSGATLAPAAVGAFGTTGATGVLEETSQHEPREDALIWLALLGFFAFIIGQPWEHFSIPAWPAACGQQAAIAAAGNASTLSSSAIATNLRLFPDIDYKNATTDAAPSCDRHHNDVLPKGLDA